MAAALDLIGSALISGLLIITMVRMNAASLENQAFFSEDLLVQENLREIVRIVESDFRKIGYRIAPDSYGTIQTDSIFILADSTHMTFRSDINRQGAAVNVDYQLGGFVTSTPNDSDRYLWRTVGGNPRQNIAAGLTGFKLRYLTKNFIPLKMPVSAAEIDTIASIELTIELQSPYVVKRQNETWLESYKETTTLWRQTRLIARNLNR